MSQKLQYALRELDAMERTAQMPSPLHGIDARAKLSVTLLFLLALLSMPLTRLSDLLLFFIYPIVGASRGGLSYALLMRRSLWVLPFVLLIGIFNPLLDRQPAFQIGSWWVSQGWVSFVSIVLRGLLSVQGVLLLVYTTGFYNLCRGMQRMGVPSVLSTQLLFVYRYLFVLLQEALSMTRARDARSFGRRSYPLRVWGVMIGQLLIRTFERAERIHRAMLSRGFDGRIRSLTMPPPWQRRDTLFLSVWGVVFVVLRFLHPIEGLTAWWN